MMSQSPVEPRPSRWQFPSASVADDDGIVAVGADLEPGTLLTAYRAGMFPMPVSQVRPMVWWSPDPRGIIPLHAVRVSRSLRRAARRFTVTWDRSFDTVVERCADPARPMGWISGEIRRAYARLHRLGWAHSVEVREPDGELAGGLYGVSINGLFAAESKFYTRTDASKVALVALAEALAGVDDALLDVQWCTDHLRSLGAVEISRAEYVRRLDLALQVVPSPFPWQRTPPLSNS